MGSVLGYTALGWAARALAPPPEHEPAQAEGAQHDTHLKGFSFFTRVFTRRPAWETPALDVPLPGC